jgi:hypothetical protein
MNYLINMISPITKEADPLHSELRILDWILYQVCSNEIKQIESISGGMRHS